MMWPALLLLLAMLGLPWFAATGATLIGFHLWAELDPALVIMEFDRLRGSETLIALPLLLLCARLLPEAPCAGRRSVWRSALEWPLSSLRESPGLDLPGPRAAASADHSRDPGAARWPSSAGAQLLAPSLLLVLVALVIEMLTPARAPGLQAVFLAAFVPAVLVQLLTAGWKRWTGSVLRRSGAGTMARGGAPAMVMKAALVVLIAGLYAGFWTLVEATAGAALVLILHHLVILRRSPRQLAERALDSAIPFGALGLLLGLGLGWAMLVGDAGLVRDWARFLNHLAGIHVLVPALAVSAVWLLSAALLGPFPALILGAPIIVPASLGTGMAAEQLAVLTVLALHSGGAVASLGSVGQGARARWPGLTAQLLVIFLIAVWPSLSLWLPGRIL